MTTLTKLFFLTILLAFGFSPAQSQNNMPALYSGGTQVAPNSVMYSLLSNSPELNIRCQSDEECVAVVGRVELLSNGTYSIQITAVPKVNLEGSVIQFPSMDGEPVSGMDIGIASLPAAGAQAQDEKGTMRISEDETRDVWSGVTNENGEFAFMTNDFGIYVVLLAREDIRISVTTLYN